jgi:NTE family protein
MKEKNGIALALSGGGFRATLFHIGSLLRLNELGWMKRLTEITSVSGGSIISAYLGYKWKKLNFNEKGIAANFNAEVVKPIRNLCLHTLDVGSIIGGILSPFHHPSSILISKYKKYLFGESTLQNLPSDSEGPRFTIYATSLQTGVSVRFSKPYIAEYHLGRIELPTTDLAKVVAASSAFPPVLCPVKFEFNPDDWKPWDEGQNSIKNQKIKSKMYLADGGVYDNLGLERIWDRYSTVLVSDAGAPFSFLDGTFKIRFSQVFRTLRVLSITIEQTRALRKRKLIQDFIDKKLNGTYWGIATKIGDYKLVENGFDPPLLKDNDLTKSMSQIRTRLNKFSEIEQENLINWGYALTDAALRQHVINYNITRGTLPYAI